jgi:hypothetical protein
MSEEKEEDTKKIILAIIMMVYEILSIEINIFYSFSKIDLPPKDVPHLKLELCHFEGPPKTVPVTWLVFQH